MNRCVWPILRWQLRFQIHETDGRELESVWWARLWARVRRIWVHVMQGAGDGAGRKVKSILVWRYRKAVLKATAVQTLRDRRESAIHADSFLHFHRRQFVPSSLLHIRMAEKPKHVYDESKIKTLSSLEHIRLRTGMYIGRLGDGSHYDDGCYVLLKEVIDNATDEYIMGCGREVRVGIDGTTVSVRDFGRGIPLGKVVDCVSKINTGAKYNDDVFQFSVGLNGVGTKAVNALSKEFLVRSHRGGECVEAWFKQGKIKGEKKGKAANESDGTFIRFEPDPEIFKKI